MNKVKKKSKIIGILIFLVGIFLCFYPWISNYYYEHQGDNLIISYDEDAVSLSKDTYNRLLEEAKAYNDSLRTSQVTLTDPFDESAQREKDQFEYDKLLCANESGLMGYIDIPVIGVHLPVFHGTSSDVLMRGAGHLEGSSLPIGGKSTHSVLTGHTGENNARLFTDLTEMKEGDIFLLSILNEKLAYKVSEINIVVPSDTEKLMIQENEDLVTLITCTPYGINSHRLLVTGKRTEYQEEFEDIPADLSGSQWFSKWKTGMEILGAVLALLIILGRIIRRIRSGKKEVKAP